MPLESANYIAQLVPANPLSTDTVSQSADHIRLLKAAIQNTFPHLDSAVTLTPAQMNYPVPKGAIIMWSGSQATIPTGWGICDGTNGTPDLRDKFVVGAGNTYSPLATGGSATTGMAGSHTHTENTATAVLQLTTGAVATGTGTTVVEGVTPQGHSHTINQVGDHSHTNLPPYLALCFIMKL